MSHPGLVPCGSRTPQRLRSFVQVEEEMWLEAGPASLQPHLLLNLDERPKALRRTRATGNKSGMAHNIPSGV